MNSTQALGIFNNTLLRLYTEQAKAKTFLQSFFKESIVDTKNVTIETRRILKTKAEDVSEDSEGNNNDVSKSTVKVYEPPLFHETFSVSKMEGYDRIFGNNSFITVNSYENFINKVAMKIALLENKINEAKTYQAAEIFQNGKLIFQNGDNINFRRKTASFITPSVLWTDPAADPIKDIFDGIEFIHTTGKSNSSIYNVIMGQNAFQLFIKNPEIKEQALLRKINLLDINMPEQISSTGGTLHGSFSAGSYNCNLWTYNDYYDTTSAKGIKYIDPNAVIILPEATDFDCVHAAIAQLVKDPNSPLADTMGNTIQTVAKPIVIYNYIDYYKISQKISVKSKFLSIPTAIDQIASIKVA